MNEKQFKELLRSLSSGDGWSFENEDYGSDGMPYTYNHISGLQLWICNGLYFYKIWQPEKIYFSFWQKVRLDVIIAPRLKKFIKQIKSSLKNYQFEKVEYILEKLK